MLLWCWVVSKLWEMFHYHFPFIKIVNVVSLSYNPQPFCFIYIMTFKILVSNAIKNLFHAQFHTFSKERLIFVSHKHYVLSCSNINSKLILQDKCISCFQLVVVNEHQLSKSGFIYEPNHAPMRTCVFSQSTTLGQSSHFFIINPNNASNHSLPS
jgi:hypothetical protein